MSGTDGGVVAATARLCDELLSSSMPASVSDRIGVARERLEGPLRVAVAGRIKAGKSTLLNALVGERLAPTDAQECTRIVSVYRRGLGYSVTARMDDGSEQRLEFRRSPNLEIDLGGLAPEHIERLLIDWPSENLSTVSYVDTPGLASVNDDVSARTRAALAADGRGTPDADAVVYLMRHLHRVDADFLEGFVAGTDAGASPVNSVAVLSRADEVGAGRLDAMDSARRVAGAYSADPRISALSSSVVAVAGLVAETAQTLTEPEFRAVAGLARLPGSLLYSILLSTDRIGSFEVATVDEATGIGEQERVALVRRLGLFGVRFAVERVRTRDVDTTSGLARALLDVSGLADLQNELTGRIAPLAGVLKARSALLTLGEVARQVAGSDAALAGRLAASLEQLIAGAHEFSELRLAHISASGVTMFRPDQSARALRLIGVGDPAVRLGLPADAAPSGVRAGALAEIEHWRALATNPLLDPLTVDACGIAARSAEGLLATLD